MLSFKNEISTDEWIAGSVIIVVMIWIHFLFPRDFITLESTALTLARIPDDYWNFIAIYPRQWDSTPAIILAHFFHLNEFHLSSNLSLLTIFMIILAKISNRFHFIIVSIAILSGVLIWLFNPIENEFTNLSGASALIFGLFGYILLRTFFNKDFLNRIDGSSHIAKPRLIVINTWISIVTLSLMVVYWNNIEPALNLNTPDASYIAVYAHLLGLVSGFVVYFIELGYILFRARS